MRRRINLILTLVAAASLSVVLAACGGGIPGNAVAQVDGEAIEKSEFDRWMKAVAQAGGQTSTSVPKPPAYADCIAEKRKSQPKPAKGQKAPTEEQLKEQCAQEYNAMRDRVMQMLVNTEWIAGEAEQQNISVSDAEVRKAFEAQKNQQFPKEADYKKFLKQSGQTEEQLLAQVRTGELARKITEKVVEGKDKVSDEEVSAYYEENKERFAQPEARDAHVVLTRDRARAQQARRALEDGDSWRSVARRYSIDPASKEAGGKLENVTEGNQDAGLEKALFGAEKGEIVGPVKTSLGYYVVEVDEIRKGSQQTLAQSKDAIRQSLVDEKKQKALEAFVKEYEKEWREKTECRDGYKVPQLCGNAPEPEESPTPAPGATPAPAPQD